MTHSRDQTAKFEINSKIILYSNIILYIILYSKNRILCIDSFKPKNAKSLQRKKYLYNTLKKNLKHLVYYSFKIIQDHLKFMHEVFIFWQKSPIELNSIEFKRIMQNLCKACFLPTFYRLW